MSSLIKHSADRKTTRQETALAGLTKHPSRIQYIDGLRGVAILAVILFHAYSRFSEIEPFKQNQIIVNLFASGRLGVQLFFAISGFVIYGSLLRSDDIQRFIVARYIRLAPTMLVASLLIYTAYFFIPEMPRGKPALVDFIPGLTFIDPSTVSTVLGVDMKSLDGAFWSLYVEVKFYLTVGFLFFICKDKQLHGLSVIFLLWLSIKAAKLTFVEQNFLVDNTERSLRYLGVNYWGWFLIGVVSYQYKLERSKKLAFALLTTSAISVLITIQSQPQLSSSIIIAALSFLLPLTIPKFQRLFTGRWMVCLGFISYPLYLIHQNIVTGLAIKLHIAFPSIPAFFLPIPFLFLVGLLAYAIASIEPHIQQRLRDVLPARLSGTIIKNSKTLPH